MAAGTLPRPGKVVNGIEIGPCIEEDCGHTDCKETREMANSKCTECGEPIGYETPFYKEEEGLVHRKCQLDKIERSE